LTRGSPGNRRAVPFSAGCQDRGDRPGKPRHIEALAASGITAGCGTGVFCPEQNVKRSEMAVYLAKALGLHWPD